MTEIPQLITKYRPITLNEVIGNENVIKALSEAMHDKTPPHVFLLTGITGIGKTSISRIIAKEVNASIVEIDAASDGSVENIRQLVEMSGYKPITVETNKMYIIDEIQNLHPKAFQPLLKLSEGLPEFLYLAFCTTELNKVPDALKNRCYHISLKPLKAREIELLLETVISLEKWEVNNDVFNALVIASNGSARKSLSLLQAGHAAKDREELSTIVAEVESKDSPIVKLCQYLIKGNKEWKTISQLLEKIEDPEEAISHACSYLTVALTRSEERQADQIWRIIQCLSENRAVWDKKIQLYAGIGKYLFGSEPF